MFGGDQGSPGCGIDVCGMPGGAVDVEVGQVCPADDGLAAEALSQRLINNGIPNVITSKSRPALAIPPPASQWF